MESEGPHSYSHAGKPVKEPFLAQRAQNPPPVARRIDSATTTPRPMAHGITS